MIRTQIQLTPEQARTLKALSATSGRSVADLVREGVDHVLRDQSHVTRGERMRRAARLFGAFESGSQDLAARHDEHFADAAAPRR